MLRSVLVRSPQHAAFQLLENSQLHPWRSITSCSSQLSSLVAASSHRVRAFSCVQPCSSGTHAAAGSLGVALCSAQQLQRQQQWTGSDWQQWPQHDHLISTLHNHFRQYSSSNENSTEKSALQRREEALRSKVIQHEFNSPTLGQLRDSYTGPRPWLTKNLLIPFPNPIALVKHWGKNIGSKMATRHALATAKLNIPGFQEAALYDTVVTMYQRINQAQAEYRLEPIKDLVSRDVFLKLRGQMEQRKMGNWDRILWEIDATDKKYLHDYVQLVHGRTVKTSQHAVFDWIQLTFRIPSRQKFAAYRVRKGEPDELIAGNPDEYIDVEDYWVFEHKSIAPVGEGLNKTRQSVAGARWRLVARLDLSEPAEK